MSLPVRRLPSGWVMAMVGDVAEYTNGLAFNADDWAEDGLPIIRIQNLTGSCATHNRTARKVGPEFVVSAGDILVSWSATLDAFIWDGPVGVLNQHIFKVVANESLVAKEFLYWGLREVVREMRESAHLHGSTMKHINRGPFLAHPFPLPPLREQRRIAATLQDLDARGQRSRTALQTLPSLLELFRQSVLAAAFRGALTADWRAEHRPEPVVVPEATAPDIKFFGDLSARGWAAERLEALVDTGRGIPYGIVQTGDPFAGGVPTVRCGDIRAFSIDVSSLKEVNPRIAAQYGRTCLRGNEVLIAIRGTVGATAVAGPDMAGMNISREVAMIPVTDRTDARYLMYFLASPGGYAAIAGHVKGVAQAGINLSDLRRLSVPLPTLDEQREIVRRLDSALQQFRSLSLIAEDATRRVDGLERSILAKAFRGELVPQDPTDEPASVLLGHIRAHRITGSSRRRTTKGRKSRR
jgi:type I restriction enzyme S subunit